MARMTRKHLEAKVEALNERLGTGYKLNYCSFYGGYAIEDRTAEGSKAPKKYTSIYARLSLVGTRNGYIS